MPDDHITLFSLKDYYENRKPAILIHRIQIILLSFLILYAPLPFGSVESHSMLLIELLALTCFLLWAAQLIFFSNPGELARFRALYRQCKHARKHSPFFHRHYWIRRLVRIFTLGQWPRKNVAANFIYDQRISDSAGMIYHSVFGYPVMNTGIEGIALVSLLLLSFQIIPLPHNLVAVLSPSTAELYQDAAGAVGTDLSYHALSLNSFLTFSKGLEYIAYFMIYLVVVNSPYRRSVFRTLLIIFALSATFQAAYGLFEFLSGHHHIFTYEKKFNRDCATGTFINRNHYAVYMEMALPILLSFVAGQIGLFKAMGGNFFNRISRILEMEAGKTALYSFMVVLVGVALLFSLSRSGIAFGLISCAVFFFLFQKANLGVTSRKTYWLMILLASAAVAVFIGFNPLLERFQRITDELSSEGPRWRVWKDTAVILSSFPLVGTGIGTFRDIFPAYQSFYSDVGYLQTHNDYLQVLSEAGILMLLIYFAFFYLFFARLRKLMTGTLSRNRIIHIGVFCSFLSLALHSITDFGFQIPAIAATASIILALFMGNLREINERERS